MFFYDKNFYKWLSSKIVHITVMQTFLSLIQPKRKKASKRSREEKLTSKPLNRELSSLIDMPLPTYSRQSISRISPQEFSKSDQPLVRLVLSHKELSQLFVQYAKQTYSVESIRAWQAIQRYRKANMYEERQQLAHYIYNTFLAPNAPDDINIREAMKQSLWNDIESGFLTEYIFDELELEIEELLADIFDRFALTREYIEFMNEHVPHQLKSARHDQPLLSSSYPTPPSFLDTSPRRMSISPRDLLCGLYFLTYCVE
jgi:hypothetical protein